MTEIRELRDIYRKVEEYILILMLVVATLIVCYSVFMRYVMLSPLLWSEELVCYIQVWITFFGVSYIARNQDDFIRFDFLIHRMNPRARSVVVFVERVLMMLFMGMLAVTSTQWIIQIYSYGGVSTPMKVPNYIPRLVIPTSFFLLLIHYVESLFEEIKRIGTWLRTQKRR